MSVTIWVENAKPVQIDSLLPEISITLKSLLGLSCSPALSIDSTWNSEEVINPQLIGWIEPNMEKGFSVRVDGEQGVVNVFSYRGVSRFVLSFHPWSAAPLCAAVAITLAKRSGAEITDLGSIYTISEYQKPDEFTRLLKVEKSFDNFHDAVECFFSRLPGQSGYADKS